MRKQEIAFFPVIFPDESLDSCVRRFYQLSGETNLQRVSRRLYGRPCFLRASTVQDVRHLADLIPGDSDLIFKKLLSDHTHHRFTRRFLLPDKNNHRQKSTDILSSSISSFRCKACDEENLKAHGVAYYLRYHSVPGVNCCWKHAIYLGSIGDNASLQDVAYADFCRKILQEELPEFTPEQLVKILNFEGGNRGLYDGSKSAREAEIGLDNSVAGSNDGHYYNRKKILLRSVIQIFSTFEEFSERAFKYFESNI